MMSRQTISLMLLLFNAWVGCLGQEFLEPELSMLNVAESTLKYSKRLRETLLRDSPQYYVAQVVCLPSGKAEWVASVVREDDEEKEAAGDPTYLVHFGLVNKSVWHESVESNINLMIVKVPIDRRTAESLRDVWRQMLLRVRYSSGPPILKEDATDFHFSYAVPLFHRGRPDARAGFFYGRTWSPDKASVSGKLAGLGVLLREFATAAPDARQAIASDILLKAKQLKDEIDRSE